MRGCLALVAALVVLLPAGLRAHGLTLALVTSEPPVAVRCAYANGDPAAAEVLVRSPADAGRYFAILRTDRHGVARFEPDQAGQWRLVADDGLGHRASLRLSVDRAGAVRRSVAPAIFLRLGLALALACIGLFAWRRRIRREGRA